MSLRILLSALAIAWALSGCGREVKVTAKAPVTAPEPSEGEGEDPEAESEGEAEAETPAPKDAAFKTAHQKFIEQAMAGLDLPGAKGGDADVEKALSLNNWVAPTSAQDLKRSAWQDPVWAQRIKDAEDAMGRDVFNDAAGRFFKRGLYQEPTFVVAECKTCRGKGFDGSDVCSSCLGGRVDAKKGWKTKTGNVTVRDAVKADMAEMASLTGGR